MTMIGAAYLRCSDPRQDKSVQQQKEEIERRAAADGVVIPAANWFVDEGISEGPSNWVISSGDLIQRSNIFGGNFDGTDPVKPGTFAHAGSTAWQDYNFSLRLMSEDNDAFGVMFRYLDAANYYRFSMDRERTYRRLIKVVNGVTTILKKVDLSNAEDAVPYEIGQSYNLRISVVGSNIRTYIDNQLILDVIDSSLTQGKVALYSWGNEYSHFADVLVTGP